MIDSRVFLPLYSYHLCSPMLPHITWSSRLSSLPNSMVWTRARVIARVSGHVRVHIIKKQKSSWNFSPTQNLQLARLFFDQILTKSLRCLSKLQLKISSDKPTIKLKALSIWIHLSLNLWVNSRGNYLLKQWGKFISQTDRTTMLSLAFKLSKNYLERMVKIIKIK